MGTDDWLNLIRVVEALDVLSILDVEDSNVIGGGQAEVQVTTVLAEVGVDGNDIPGLWTEIIKKLSSTLGTIGLSAESAA